MHSSCGCFFLRSTCTNQITEYVYAFELISELIKNNNDYDDYDDDDDDNNNNNNNNNNQPRHTQFVFFSFIISKGPRE